MKNSFLKRLKVSGIALIIISSPSFCQFSDVDFLKSAPSDAVKFIEAYITPWANAFGAGLNGSWYNTAKPHKFGGFDITFGVNVGFVPSSAESFEISSLGLSSSITGSGTAPTIAGPTDDGPALTYTEGGVTLATFNTPPGTAWKYIPVPTLQAGIGLPFGSELKVRLIPRIPVSDGDVMLWGLGLMHSIMQYVPGNDLIPADASVFAGYTRLNGNVPLSLPYGAPSNYVTYNEETDFNNQSLSVTVGALNVCAIGSFNLPVISFYGGLGYSRTRTLAELKGNFPTPVLVATGTPHAEYNDSGVRKGSDFPEMDIKNFSGLRTNIGFRIKLAVVTFYADYTRSQYNVLSAGLGVSFR
jgi:hypothetical protein